MCVCIIYMVVEVALQYANNEVASHPEDRIAQIILIGDAPANSRDQVLAGRERHGALHWAHTRFQKATYIDDEILTLQANCIPLNCFYVAQTDGLAERYAEWARATNGEVAFLDINSTEGATQLTDLVTKRIMFGVGGIELVEAYERQYMRGYAAPS